MAEERLDIRPCVSAGFKGGDIDGNVERRWFDCHSFFFGTGGGKSGAEDLGDIDCIFDRSQLRATIKEVLMLEN